MKAAALVLTAVFREVAAGLPYAIGLQLVTDEEVGGADGTGHQLAQGVRAGFVVIGEQSALRVVTESKGICHARLSTTGRAAHAAYPWLGSNALGTLTAAIDRLLARYPVPPAEEWTTTVNVARIETPNHAYNQVPAAAEAWLDIRFPPTDPDFAARTVPEVTAYLGQITGSEVTVDALGRPHHADPDGPGVVTLRKAIRATGHPGELLRKHGAADARYYHALGIDAVIFGPGGDGQHGPAEYVDLTTLRRFCEDNIESRFERVTGVSNCNVVGGREEEMQVVVEPDLLANSGLTYEAVRVALDLGADVNAVDNNGETAMHSAAYKNLPQVVKFLAARGAKVELWNRNDKFGWTPLAIAVGYRFGNFKPAPETEAAIREVMIAAGVTPPKTVVAKTQQIY